MAKIKELHHGYTIGDVVYVKPNDWGVLKCKIVGFQQTDEKLPIVECKHPYKKGEMFKNAMSLDRISKTKTITLHEWRIVPVKYTYKS